MITAEKLCNDIVHSLPGVVSAKPSACEDAGGPESTLLSTHPDQDHKLILRTTDVKVKMGTSITSTSELEPETAESKDIGSAETSIKDPWGVIPRDEIFRAITRKGSSSTLGDHLSCPFRKRNPARFNVRDYPSCTGPFESITRLK